MNEILWALLTGGVRGGVWVAIVLFGRLRDLSARQRELLDDRQHALDALEAQDRRLRQLDERLEFVQRMLHPTGRPGIDSERHPSTPAPGDPS